MTVLSVKQTGITYEQFSAFYQLMLNHEDNVRAEKILDLFEKYSQHDITIGFTGHFSAGKSSIINALLGKDILPKGPIPTSANIVKISSGEERVRIFFYDGKPVEYVEPYNIDEIKDYCKDRDTIKRIDINTSNPILPIGCSFVDTPGIDAANDIDRLITESSLHVLDVLFYVTDYNHVQSEVNMQFLQKIDKANIPYFIIVNQIDKHNDSELSFANFNQHVKQTFIDWSISPQAIYYTSLVDEKLVYNQFKDVKELISKIFGKSRDSYSRITNAFEKVVSEHKTYLQQLYDEKVAILSLTELDQYNDCSKLNRLNETIANLKRKTLDLKSVFQNDMESTLKNAYLMPADLREQAASFLESQQKDFKIGIIASKRKTNEEKEKRFASFLTALEQNTNANLVWKLRDKLTTFVAKHVVSDRDQLLVNEIQQFSLGYPTETILSPIKTGAKLNGDYVLNYTNELSNMLKLQTRKKLWMLWDKIEQIIEQEVNKQLDQYKQQLVHVQTIVNAQEEYAKYQADLSAQLENLNTLWKEPIVLGTTCSLITDKLKERNESNKIFHQSHSKTIMEKEVQAQQRVDQQQLEVSKHTNLTREHMIPKLNEAIKTIESSNQFEAMLIELIDKRNRLCNRSLTIALFGAFSAGKSSFANALIGEEILPVSPNPTTAVITRICPPTKENHHRTVKIKLKDEATLVNDIVTMLNHSFPEFNSLAELLTWVEQYQASIDNNVNKLHQAYLLAIRKGYEQNRQFVGKEITVDFTDFAQFATDETKACYIESMDVYYDCSITKRGITLVDTPGADSINARHTSVAFDYIKYADAILFVTYYNHAFSKADKDFLIQLGRVKEAFELDKMYFIINAADLAENERELQLVNDYVEDQLLQLGIRHPKVFPLSSKQSLLEKQAGSIQLNTKINAFETEFYRFILEDIDSLMIRTTLKTIERISEHIGGLIVTANMDKQEKIKFREKLLASQNKLHEVIRTTDFNVFTKRINQKVEKQLHYVNERLAIRFHDLFKDNFNPTTVTESGKRAITQLEANLYKLFTDTGYELLQEVRAVSLRIEAYIRELRVEIYGQYEQLAQEIDTNFKIASLDSIDFLTPKYEKPLSTVEMQAYRKLFSKYKGTKAFFVHNEKEQMKEALYVTLTPEIKRYLNDVAKKMVHEYGEQWNREVNNLQMKIIADNSTYVEQHIAMVTESNNVADLQEKQARLTALL